LNTSTAAPTAAINGAKAVCVPRPKFTKASLILLIAAVI
jgi:hypothetical protein